MQKVESLTLHKVLEARPAELEELREQDLTLLFWLAKYFREEVSGSASPHTADAKLRDLQKFMLFYLQTNGHAKIEEWLRRDTEVFIRHLEGCEYKPASINRMLASVKHFARFCFEHEVFRYGHPTRKVRDLELEQPRPKGLSPLQVQRMLKACDVLCKLRNHRKRSSPVRNRAIFLTLLHTGLRVSELCSLNISQYRGKKFRQVKGKGRKYRDVYVKLEARKALDDYLELRGAEAGPLFLTNRKTRLSRQRVRAILKDVANQANSTLPEKEKISIHPHMLRHTHAQAVQEKLGEAMAVERLGHSSERYIRVYTKRSDEVEEEMLESF